MTRIILPLLAGLTFLAACGGDTTPDEAPAAARGDSAVTSTASAPSTDATPRPNGFEPIDPKMGGLVLNAKGEHSGKWTFKDVNGSMREMAGGGATMTLLQLEAHEDPVHFKLRMTTPDGELRPGRYRVGDAERKLDATYENAGVYYTAVGDAGGWVELTTISDDRAIGSFDLTLEGLSESKPTAKVSGTFDMIVQK